MKYIFVNINFSIKPSIKTENITWITFFSFYPTGKLFSKGKSHIFLLDLFIKKKKKSFSDIR